MGDISTHVIFFQGYWHLAYKDGDDWTESRSQVSICDLAAAERVIELK